MGNAELSKWLCKNMGIHKRSWLLGPQRMGLGYRIKEGMNDQIQQAICTPERVVGSVCDEFQVSHDDLIGKKRPNYITYARFAVCHILSRDGYDSFRIASVLNRGRSNVSHSLRVASDLLETDRHFRMKLKRVTTALKRRKSNKPNKREPEYYI